MSNNKPVRLSFSKIELLDQNATGQLNQTELDEWAMKKFNLDQSLAQQTISNILKNTETLYSNINVVNNGKSLKTTRYPQLDEVVKFAADMTITICQSIEVQSFMHGESASVDITSESIQNELRKREELLGSYDPVDIMNFDETEENDNTEQGEQCVDIVECKKRLREAYETTLMDEVPLDDLARKIHCRIRMRLADSCAELNKSKE
ncbi:hypothetical protein G6F43_010982 [Rhizopus delemar]|nr:hypothetical protein G6F43_010982 [Rhizopus delemar]